MGAVAAAANLLLAALKALAGWVSNSHALLADAVESLTDLGTTVGLVAALRLARRPPDEGHPYGHRRLEAEASRMAALVLMAAGAAIGWRSLRGFAHPSPVGWAAPAVAALSVVAKEWLYRYSRRAARRLDSQALLASAWHHRSDALTSVVTLAAVAGAAAGWRWLDPLAGATVAAVVVAVGARLYARATRELLDAAPSRAVMERLRRAAAATPGVLGVGRLRARLHGSQVLADLTIQVHPALSVDRGHQIADGVEQALRRAVPQLVDVTVHVEPSRARAGRGRPRPGP